MTERVYRVRGMSCAHCARAVSAEVGNIDGVTGVDADVTSARVTVSTDLDVSTESVRAAVEEAGYELLGEG